jgi:phosphoglucosamine mutase
MANMRHLFGTDGVRGHANVHPMTPEVALALGMAAGLHFRAAEGRHRIVIGKDTRLSGYMLESALTSGICAMGADVVLVGPLPTPAIAFITRSLRADAGIVISASHNPYGDNGIKFFGRDGRKLPDETEARLEDLMEGLERCPRPTDTGIGKAFRLDDAEGRYIEFAKATIPRGMLFDGLRMVVDCAHGAAYKAAPAIFRELGAKVIAIGDQPDGTNINRGCGATHPETMRERVLAEGADLGLALDGDGDRAILVDARGELVDGDDVLFLIANILDGAGRLEPRVVVGTEMSNLGLEVALRDRGVRLERAGVGDRYVLERMTDCGAVLGGEPSGHVIFLAHQTTGDGIITGLQTVSSMVGSGRTLAELRAGWRRYPHKMVNIRVREKKPLEGMSWLGKVRARAERELGADRILSLRYSGTEPLLRVTVSCPSPERVDAVSEMICAAFRDRMGEA